ncbi:ABC transporter substrate-binding protein [Sphingomonas elodea]|uniref:ABC transporter substrate-binding protein n=1 Tax=Sphingomonas elodea TaxID=179878 RepID=UPI0002630D0F|nr:ABC transporter substrate-binding protein [Sphingomonas elodea]
MARRSPRLHPWIDRRGFVGLSLAVAACGPGSGGGGGGRGGPNGDFTYPASDYRSGGGGKRGGTIRIATSTDTGTLDVHAISHGNVQWLGRMLFDNLVYLDATGAISSWIAREWTISPDGLVYTFRLRPGVTFSDGMPLDAEAVRTNLEHMRDPRTKSPLAAAYIAPYVEGRAIDPLTFEARLAYPYAPFLNVLAQSWLGLISPRQIREAPQTIADRPIGSGPFTVERYVRQQGIRLKRRDDYAWAPDVVAHRGAALLDAIEVDIVPEALSRYAGLAQGQYHLLADTPYAKAAAIRADPALVVDSRIRTGLPWRALSFNTERWPFDDVRLRQALALGIDREGITRSVFFDEFLPSDNFLARTTRHYDPSTKGKLPFDPADANRRLDALGWAARDTDGYRTKDGRRLSATLIAQDSPSATPINVAVQSNLKKLGFDLKIELLPTPVLTDRRNRGDYQAVAGGVWHTNTPDALYILHHSNEITSPKRIGQNVSRLRDGRLDDLLERARRTSDDNQQRVLYAAAQHRLIELVPSVPLDENHSLIAYRRELKGLVFDTSHNTPQFLSAWLEPTA